MPPELQVKLLRVLETGQVDAGGRPGHPHRRRAGGGGLEPRPRRGGGRGQVPPGPPLPPQGLPHPRCRRSRERGSDIELLAEHFLAEVNRIEGRRQRLSAEALAALRRHNWPGNVRELKNVIHRAAILAGDEIVVGDLPPEILGDSAPPELGSLRVAPGTPLADVQRRLVLATMNEFNQDRSRTAEALGISVRTLYNWLKEYQALGVWTDPEKAEEPAPEPAASGA